MKKKSAFSFILGSIIFGSITMVSAYTFFANAIDFTPKDSTWNVDNTQDAIDDLYNLAEETSNVDHSAKLFLYDVNPSLTLNDVLSLSSIYKNSTIMDRILENSDYTNLILSSSSAIKALDNSNPIMSTDTTKLFASSHYNVGSQNWVPAYVFDTTDNYWSVGAGLSYKNQYLGYDFGTPVWVYKMVIRTNNGKQNTDYVLEASNDKTNYTIIKDGLHQPGTTVTVIPNNYNERYRYYRIRFLSTVAQSGDGNTVVFYLRFYAK